MKNPYIHQPSLPYSTKTVSADGVLQYYHIDGSSSGDIVRLNLGRLGINAFIDELNKPKIGIFGGLQGNITLESLSKDLEYKKGGSKPIPPSVSALHVCTEFVIWEHDDMDLRFQYTWGYNYKTLRRVNGWEKRSLHKREYEYTLVVSLIQDSTRIPPEKDEAAGRYYARQVSEWLRAVTSTKDYDYKPLAISELDADKEEPSADNDDELDVLDEPSSDAYLHPVYNMPTGYQEDEEVFEDEDEDMVDDAKKKKGGFEGLGSLFG